MAGNHSRAFAVPFPEPLVESFGEVLRRLQKLLLPSTDAPHNSLHLFLPWRLLRLPRLEREIMKSLQFEYCVINQPCLLPAYLVHGPRIQVLHHAASFHPEVPELVSQHHLRARLCHRRPPLFADKAQVSC